MARSQRSRRLLIAGAVILVVVTLAVLALIFYRAFDSLPKIKVFALRLGPYAPLGLILIQIIQIVFAPVPGTIISIASGYLFGVGRGTFFTMIGVVAGTTIVLGLSRSVGRRLVVRLVKKQTLDKWDGRLQKWGLNLIFFLYLIPNPLGDVVSYLAGLTGWPLPTLIIIAAVGRLPGVILSSFVGYKTTSLSTRELIVFIAGFVIFAVVYYLLRKKIAKLVFGKQA